MKEQGLSEDQLRLLRLAAHPDPEHEFREMIGELREMLGYGRMMQLISYAWRASLESQGIPPDGALVPALLTDLPKDEQRTYLAGYAQEKKRACHPPGGNAPASQSLDAVVIVADGGCSGNGTKDAVAYGSYCVRFMAGKTALSEYRSGRIDYPELHTNNAAEIQVCIDALSRALKIINAEICPVIYQTDSQLVVGWLAANWKVKQPHLIPLVEQARKLAARIGNLTFTRVPRAEIVRILGH